MNSWLSSLFRLTEIFEKKGPDAYQYLLFQQYIIVLLLVLSIVCILILLPINIQGNNGDWAWLFGECSLESNKWCLLTEGKAFARTTLSNLSNDSPLYWVHAISATCTVMMVIYFGSINPFCAHS